MDLETGILFNDQMDDFSIPGVPNAFGLYPSPYNYIGKLLELIVIIETISEIIINNALFSAQKKTFIFLHSGYN